jgi:hypothetical protein
MTRLPQLEAQLVAAAARPRAKRRMRLAGAAALALAACVAAALLLAPRSEPQRRDRPVAVPQTVPAAALVKARALAKAPLPRPAKPQPGRLNAQARRMMARTPYPPGMTDHYNWDKRPWAYPTTLALQGSVERHAYCLWMIYWVGGADRAGAAAVLEQSLHWPTQRQKDNHLTYFQNKIQTALRERDMAVLGQEASNCKRELG